MAEARWYVVHTYSGYENKVKANLEKTIANRHLEDEILEVRIPMQDVAEYKKNGPKNEAGPHTRDHGMWRFRYDKQWKGMPRLHLWDADYSSAHVVDLFENFVGSVGGAD